MVETFEPLEGGVGAKLHRRKPNVEGSKSDAIETILYRDLQRAEPRQRNSCSALSYVHTYISTLTTLVDSASDLTVSRLHFRLLIDVALTNSYKSNSS
jgi:hypothetical protein